MIYTERQCRLCRGQLESILDLGELALSDFVQDDQELQRAPLDLCACVDCTLVQLRHTTNPDLLFRKYWYLSGINEMMREELADIAEKAKEIVPMGIGDVIFDIGANDGTLLSAFPQGTVRVGFEPALNLQEQLRRHTTLTVPDYFPSAKAPVTRVFKGKVKIITSIAMFYDLDDPISFVEAIAQALHPDGVWIVQFQDLDQMTKATAFDNICHEHLVYWSLETFEDLIAFRGLKVVKAEKRAINGGSYRLYVRWNNHKADASVDALRHLETGCQEWSRFYHFGWAAGEVKKQICGVLEHLLATGKTVDIYGASTKFNTLAQWCGIDGELVRQAWERSPDKFGRKTVTGIPIVNELEGRMNPPDALFVGIWQFRDAILKREARYLDDPRHAFIFPLPHVEIVMEEDR